MPRSRSKPSADPSEPDKGFGRIASPEPTQAKLGGVLFVCGPLQPMERPRRGKHGNYYTPKKSQTSKAEVAMAALTARNNLGIFKPFKGPVSVEGTIAYVRGDLDNAQKTLGDGLEGILVKNDSQIHEWIIAKSQGKQTRIIVTPLS